MKSILAAAALAALALPSLARAGDVAMRVQEIPLGNRTLAAAPRPMHFNMLAVHWIGGGTVEVRTHRLHGGWSPWQSADADAAPDGGTGRWHDGNLAWTGASDAVRFRRVGDVRRLRAYELWSRVTTAPARTLAEAGAPPIVTRSAWAANEEIVRAKPVLAAAVRLAVVHHTAGTNSYTRAQSAAIVRGIELYHVKGNGWNDIGYNFLVDRFGTVYEGRAGGVDRPVVGAHAEGFNSGTVGVALMGNFQSAATPPAAMQSALVDLLAWRLDVAHVDPLARVAYTSGGNLKFKLGKVVTLRAISGHRDTGPSECPGARAYALLPAIARRVARTGLPKLYAPSVAGAAGGPVRFQARLSSALPWTVTIADSRGKVVATGTGTGTVADWTWRSPPGKGSYTWTISAPGILPATGTLGRKGPAPAPAPQRPLLTGLVVAPAVVAPAPDGSGDLVAVTFKLGTAATVAADVVDASGKRVLPLEQQPRPAGANSFEWAAHTLADGRYRVVVAAAAAGKRVTKAANLVVDRTLTGLAATPAAFSPNGDGAADATAIAFTLAAAAPVRVDVTAAGQVVATPFEGQLEAGEHTIAWDGFAAGAPLPDGAYTVLVTFGDALGTVSLALPVVIDTVPPQLSVVDPRSLTFTLDEPATVTAVVNGTAQVVEDEPQGTFTLPFAGIVAQVSATATDAAGNVSPAVGG